MTEIFIDKNALKHMEQDTTDTANQTNNTTTPTPTPAASGGIQMKDLLIPVSVIVAGLFIAGGLYFGGESTSPIEGDVAVAVAGQQAQPAGTTDKVNPVTEDDHIKGSIDAPITIVEYSDFDCPFCSRFHTTMNEITEKYSGDEVAWVYRHFPLAQLHPQAAAVSSASECVAELGGNDAFWSFTDAYYAARGAQDATPHAVLIPRLALATGVSQTAFTECFESGRKADDVQEDLDNAVETGGRGTPWSILIGPTGKTYPINGALPQSAVEQLIEVARQEA
jgi:protein-disulfide isomerase